MTEETLLPPPSLDEEQISNVSSSSSSFVPVESITQDAIQVINEHKEFNAGILEYINTTTPGVGPGSGDTVGNNYHIISVFGSQSTGKSTLLNNLFNTNFDVMDETNRQQTTKGIWMAYSPHISTSASSNKQISTQSRENVFVMDVEGTDGRERGEDQDFERKAALFALSTSEILIINVWEHQIGLYHGANMGLLKTVFEVNLNLFGGAKLNKSSSNGDHKVLLLFVIRDFVGNTPKENLASTLTETLLKIWDSLNKPEELLHFKFEDFFDLEFHTLRHKIYQEVEFKEDVQKLGDKLVDHTNPDYLFKPNYHHNIPIDGWTMYSEQCWEQIDSNKDLDLPTQQILVAKFKCDEILNAVYDEFLSKYHQKIPTTSGSTSPNAIGSTKSVANISAPSNIAASDDTTDYEQLGLYMTDLLNDTLEDFDHSASRYNKSVYDEKRIELINKMHTKFQATFVSYVKRLSDEISISFKEQLKQEIKAKHASSSNSGVVIPLIGIMEILKESHEEKFTNTAEYFSLNGALSVVPHYYNLSERLEEVIENQQLLELNNIVNKTIKKLSSGLNKFIIKELSEPTSTSWDKILQYFETTNAENLQKYRKGEEGEIIDFGLGTYIELNKQTVACIKYKSWIKFHELIRKYVSKDNFLGILKERFEDKFRYDENGLPRLYQNVQELEIHFKRAKEFALKIVPFVSIAKLSDGSEILPEYDIFDKSLQKKYNSVSRVITDTEAYDDSESEDEDEGEYRHCFATIISEKDKSTVLTKFKRETDAIFVETNRSIVQHVTQIPYYIYIIIMVLGWNEFLAVIRNPLFFLLILVFGGAIYVLYTLNLLKPAIVVVQRMVDEGISQGKTKIKEWVIDEHDFHAHNLNKISNKNNNEQVEEIELDDLIPMKSHQ